MYRMFNKRINKNVVIIQPGELYVTTKDDEAIATVLGSCVSVCLVDPDKKVGGMNHFMLPGDFRNEEIFNSKSGRYGMFAMESLINEIMKKGGRKEKLIAKVFGGGHVLNFRKSDGNVPDANINFAKTYLGFEEIPIQASDLGGNAGRKIIFLPFIDAKVMVKRLSPTGGDNFIKEEQKYKADMFKKEKKKKTENKNEVTLFD